MEEDLEEEDESTCRLPTLSGNVVRNEFHVIYSNSYRVPVLFFLAASQGDCYFVVFSDLPCLLAY